MLLNNEKPPPHPILYFGTTHFNEGIKSLTKDYLQHVSNMFSNKKYMMKHIKEAVKEPLSAYTGSEKTYQIVADQIEKKYGKKELENYDPYRNTLTFSRWLSLGFRVKKGEKALVSTTVIEEKNTDGKTTKRVPRKVFLFYEKQVEKIND